MTLLKKCKRCGKVGLFNVSELDFPLKKHICKDIKKLLETPCRTLK